MPIHLNETVWVGPAACADTPPNDARGLLNVAKDLRGMAGWPTVEYMQVGLVDGPGNTVAAYHAAVLALAALQEIGPTLVFCHGGSRSMAVCLMYLNLGCDIGWDGWFARLSEQVDADLPQPHEAHRRAFDKLNWKMLAEVTK